MTKTIVSEGAGLGCDGDGQAIGVRTKIGHTTTIEILGQQSSGICSVSQSRGCPLHGAEGGDEGRGVRDVVDGSRLYTEPSHRHWDQTIGVALVGLSYNLVDVAGDV